MPLVRRTLGDIYSITDQERNICAQIRDGYIFQAEVDPMLLYKCAMNGYQGNPNLAKRTSPTYVAPPPTYQPVHQVVRNYTDIEHPDVSYQLPDLVALSKTPIPSLSPEAMAKTKAEADAAVARLAASQATNTTTQPPAVIAPITPAGQQPTQTQSQIAITDPFATQQPPATTTPAGGSSSTITEIDPYTGRKVVSSTLTPLDERSAGAEADIVEQIRSFTMSLPWYVWAGLGAIALYSMRDDKRRR